MWSIYIRSIECRCRVYISRSCLSKVSCMFLRSPKGSLWPLKSPWPHCFFSVLAVGPSSKLHFAFVLDEILVADRFGFTSKPLLCMSTRIRFRTSSQNHTSALGISYGENSFRATRTQQEGIQFAHHAYSLQFIGV